MFRNPCEFRAFDPIHDRRSARTRSPPRNLLMNLSGRAVDDDLAAIGAVGEEAIFHLTFLAELVDDP